MSAPRPAISPTQRFLVVAGLLLIAALLLPLFFRHDDSLGRLQQKGVIRIGYAIEAPYAFLTPDGEVTGESPEIARIVCKQLSISHITWQQMDFQRLLDALNAGHIDLIAAGMFATDSRRQRAAFSQPTIQVYPGYLLRQETALRLGTAERLEDLAGLRLAVLAGSVEEEQALQSGFTEDRLVRVPDALTGQKAVENGLAEALALSLPTVKWMVKQNGADALMAWTPPRQRGEPPTGQAAFAFRREDQQLRQAWNKALGSYLGSKEHCALLRQFGMGEQEVPAIATKP